ncbi:MAG: hypothetical protein QNK05_08625 [Myxococcota bacterium]|nr:hypothetical protein [Myxococcota bacterium]
MSDLFQIKRRRKRTNPMHARKIGSAAAAAAGGGAVGEFPGIEMPEPASGKERIVSGLLSAFLHAALIGAGLLAVWLAPEEVIEEIIEITRIQEEVVEQQQEPAPAPRVVAESATPRFDPAQMALPPQIINPAVVQRAAPAVNAERLQIDTVAPVQAPKEITRAATQVEQARAYQSVAVATASPVAVDAQAPAIRGPIEIQAPSGIQAGPRQVAAVGNTVGLAAPGGLGTGSSVRDGMNTGRDVVGAKTGARAQVNWAVGDGARGRGGDGIGEGGVSFEACMGRASVQAYMSRVRGRILDRWVLPPNVDANQAVTLKFSIDPAGTATRVDLVTAPDPSLGESAVRAMRSASPFEPMSADVRCLANSLIQGTFTNSVAN